MVKESKAEGFASPIAGSDQPHERAATLNEATDRIVRMIAIHRETAGSVTDSDARASILKFADGAEWVTGLLRQWAREVNAPAEKL